MSEWTVTDTCGNGRFTVLLVRDELRELGYYLDTAISIEEQKSQSSIIQSALRRASKRGDGVGKPEFIITSTEHTEFVLVIECKADPRKHESQERDHFADFAVDGVLLYAAHLARNFNVIAIAVSGQDRQSLKVSTFLHVRDTLAPKELVNESNHQAIDRLLSFSDYIHHATYDPLVEQKRFEDLSAFSRKLHKFMRNYLAIEEAEKPLIVSGVLIALENKAFARSYADHPPEELPEALYVAIDRQIKKANIPHARKENIMHPYSFITANPRLRKHDPKLKESPLKKVIVDIEKNVLPFVKTYEHFDVIGSFYEEFLRFAGGDTKLGIVLTPKHITELFATIAELTPQSVVLDICTGTAGFLIAAMDAMLDKCQSEDEKLHVRSYGLIGIEEKAKMFALAASNMILRGDGKTNLYLGSCFDENYVKEIRRKKPTVGMINPPYSQNTQGLEELEFVRHMMDLLEPDSIGIAIIPVSCVLGDHPLKGKLLKHHRLDAVMTMPRNLFGGRKGAMTSILVLRAKVPHNSNPHHKTWFGYWRDDGYDFAKNKGRVDVDNRWKGIRELWLSAYFSKQEVPGLSLMQKVTADDEWSVEAYMETDYSLITEEDYLEEMMKYILFKLSQNYDTVR